MASGQKLMRLCRLREIEEEQSWLELERALDIRNRLERELKRAAEQDLATKREFADCVSVDDRPGRVGATLAADLAGRTRKNLATSLSEWDAMVAELRENFLQRRTRRQQIDTLVGAMKREAETLVTRRAQQMLDDWYVRRNQKVTIGSDRD